MTNKSSDKQTGPVRIAGAGSRPERRPKAKPDKKKGKTGTKAKRRTADPEWHEVHGPHDRFTRQMLADLATVVSLMRWAAAPALAVWIDWASVRFKSGTQVTDDLDEFRADLVVEFRFIGGTEWAGRALIEHQRRVDATMVHRSLHYNNGMLQEWMNEHSEEHDYPYVVNFVLFTGRDGTQWTAPTTMQGLSHLPAALRPATPPVGGLGHYTLIDVAHMEPATIVELPITDRAKVALVLVRRATKKADLSERLQILMPCLHRLAEDPRGQSALRATAR